jgi:hypothetical protein
MATITIDIPPGAAQRVSDAIGSLYRLKNADGTPRGATTAEVKQHLIALLKNDVRKYEVARALNAAQAGVSDIDAT